MGRSVPADSYYVGTLSEDVALRPELRGWLVGHFMSGARRTQAVEVKYWTIPEIGRTQHGWKREKIAVEFTVVLAGKVKAWLDGQTVELGVGDYVVIQPGVYNNAVVVALEVPATGITIKAPSDGSKEAMPPPLGWDA